MKKLLSCVSLIFLTLTSCTGFRPVPTPEIFTEMKKIVIVAVEATLFNSAQVNGWVFLGPAHPPGGEADLSLISNAVSLLAKEIAYRNPGMEAGAPSGAPRETWSPALALAGEAATLISSASTCEVVVRQEQHNLPLSPRDNARSVLEGWYRRNHPALDARELKQVGPFPILELGLSDLFLDEDQLLIQILTKVVDPLSGKVKARSKGQAMVKVGSAEELFLHGGEKFKAVFSAAGRNILEKNLRDMGILSTKGNLIHSK